MAVDATKTLGLSVAGVDMIRSNEVIGHRG